MINEKNIPGKIQRRKKETVTKKPKLEILKELCRREVEESESNLKEEEEEEEVAAEVLPQKCEMPRLVRSLHVNSKVTRNIPGRRESSIINSPEEGQFINSNVPSILTLHLRQGMLTKTFTYNLVLSPLESITPELLTIRTPTISPLSSNLGPWLSIGSLEQHYRQATHTTCLHSLSSPHCSIK